MQWFVELKYILRKIQTIINDYKRLGIPTSHADFTTVRELINEFEHLIKIIPPTSFFRSSRKTQTILRYLKDKIIDQPLISIIIPTRHRVELLDKCISSIYDLATDKGQIETIILCDNDDDASILVAKSLKAKYSKCKIKIICKNRSKQLLRDYQNYGANIAKGKMIWGFNDDVEILTHGYDKILQDNLNRCMNEWSDGIFYIHIDDGTIRNINATCCFPILTQQIVKVIGGTSIDELNSRGSDHELWNIFNKLLENRIMWDHNIKLKHFTYQNGTHNRDNVNLEIELNCKLHEYNSEITQQKYINKLNDAILRNIT